MTQTDVTVDITKNTPALSAPGFGTPFIFGYTVPTLRTSLIGVYTDSDGIAADYAADAPESIAANAILAQDGHPEQVKIGRGVLPPTMAYEVSVAAVRNSHSYLLEVFGTGMAFAALAPASDSSATNDEIVAAMVSSLNGVPGRTYTASATGTSGSQVCTVVATSAGVWFSLRIVNPDDLHTRMTHADPGVTTDLTALNNIDSDWYALHTMHNSKAFILGSEAWVSTHSKLYEWDTVETTTIDSAPTGSLDSGDSSKALSYSRSGGNYYDDPSKMMSAAHYGATLGNVPGQVNWKFKTLEGVPVLVTLNDTRRANLTARLMGSYETRFGRGCTFEGNTFDGNFFDTQRNRDWLTQTMIVNVAQPLFDNANVPMNNRGIQIFVGKMKMTLAQAVDQEVLLDDPAPTTSAPKAKDIDPTDRQQKILRNLLFFGTQASGVNTVKIKGSISF